MQAEYLTDELKKLCAWGAHPKRLPLLPTLRNLAGVDDNASLMAAGYLIRRYLIASINSLSGEYEFGGKSIPAEKMRIAYRLLFVIDTPGHTVPNRRYRALKVLGLYYSLDQWRRPYGQERDFLLILAEHMTDPPVMPVEAAA